MVIWIPPIVDRVRDPSPIGNPVEKVRETLTDSIIPEPLTRAFENLSDVKFWQRAGTMVLGIWLCYIGVILILANTRAAKSALSLASSTATKGIVNV